MKKHKSSNNNNSTPISSQLEQEKAALQSQVVDQNNDLGSLRKELLQAEQTRLDLDSEKISLHEKLKFLEIEKEKVS